MLSQSSHFQGQVVAVTGAAGQLGRLVLQRLFALDEVSEVLALDLVKPSLEHPKLTFVKTDIRDADFSTKIPNCDVLIHLAFVVTNYLPRAEYDAINVEGSKNVFRAAAKVGVSQVIYSSSVAAYGVCHGHPPLIDEESPRFHVEDFPYSSAKYRVEEFLDEFEKNHPQIATVRFRPSILIGEHFNNPLALLFGRALDRGYIIGASDVPMPIVWDEDVADACILALQKRVSGAFNLSAEPLSSPREIAARLGINVLGINKFSNSILTGIGRLKILAGQSDAVDPAWGRNGNIAMAQSCEKARRELAWNPKYKTGIAVIQNYLATASSRPARPGLMQRVSGPLRQIYSRVFSRSGLS